MWRNYLTVGVRSLIKNKTYAFINIFGLAIGLAACLMILLYVRYETSYDRWIPDGDRIFSWQLAAAVRPSLFVFTSLGRLGHDRDDPHGLKSGLDGRITVTYRFSRPGQDITLFARTMTIEARKDTPLPDRLFQQANPARIDEYHAAVARELAGD